MTIIDSRRRHARPASAKPSKISTDKMPAAKSVPDLRGTPSIVGMSEWLQMLGNSVDDIDPHRRRDMRADRRPVGSHQRPQHHSRRRDERQRQHMRFCGIFPSCARLSHWIPAEERFIHLTTPHPARRTDSHKFTANLTIAFSRTLLRAVRSFATAVYRLRPDQVSG